MAVNAINSISFRGNKRINREDRERVRYNPNHEVHASSSLKAVPLVVLLAMSPLNPVNGQNLIKEGKTVNKVSMNLDGTQGKRFTYTEEDDKAKGYFDDIKLIFKSEDGDDKPESVNYVTKSTMARDYRKDGQTLKALVKEQETFTCKALKTKTMHRTDLYGKPYTTTSYYILGSSVIFSRYYDRKNPEILLGSETAKNPNAVMSISEELYNQIADTMEDNIEYIKE